MDVLEFPFAPYFAQDLGFQAFDAVVFACVAQGALCMVGKDDDSRLVVDEVTRQAVAVQVDVGIALLDEVDQKVLINGLVPGKDAGNGNHRIGVAPRPQGQEFVFILCMDSLDIAVY